MAQQLVPLVDCTKAFDDLPRFALVVGGAMHRSWSAAQCTARGRRRNAYKLR